MKGKACSWRDIRRIKHILKNQDRLKGEMSALTNCVDKSTLSTWRRAIELGDVVDICQLQHTQPSHGREIVRHAPKESWPQWVESCEKNQWTVVELRSVLLGAKAVDTCDAAERSTPCGIYRTVVVDPPWEYSNKSGRHGASQNARYVQEDRTMTLDEVCLFDIGRWVPADDCHLYLWVTDAYAGDINQVIRAWGFTPKVQLVWVKDRIGMGNYFRHQHEICAFATKGTMRLSRMDASTVFTAPVTKHSEKPDEFYRLVESCSPGPYLDVFARKKRPGWSVFGDEIPPEYQGTLDGKTSVEVIE